ncbi:AlpA family transcriptional regulator [Planktomarina temperata]|jgi:prophage regulatory protein|nr:AlpA family transcriptional regulator [Planktomarina temperata]MDA8830832.1 AlpA family transcriptional regulator [Planktomarina temperata]
MLPQIFRRKDLEERLKLSRSSIYAMMAEGEFPKPIRLGRRAVGWLSDDIEKWLQDLQGDLNDNS